MGPTVGFFLYLGGGGHVSIWCRNIFFIPCLFMLRKYIEHCLDSFVFSNIPNHLEVSINGRFLRQSVYYCTWEFLIGLAQGNLLWLLVPWYLSKGT
jgi:hypothetical protein